MDVLDKNKNANTQIQDPGKTLDAATGGHLLNTKNVDKMSSDLAFPTLIHFSSNTTSSGSSDKSSDSDSSDNTKPADSITEVSQAATKTIETTDEKPANPSFSPEIDSFFNTSKNSAKPSISTQVDNEKVKFTDSLTKDPKVFEKEAKKLWLISPINKEHVKSSTEEKEKETEIIKPNIISRAMDDIKSFSLPVKTSSLTAKSSYKSSEPPKDDKKKKITESGFISKTMNKIKKIYSSTSANAGNNSQPKPLGSDKLSVLDRTDSSKIEITNFTAEAAGTTTKNIDEKPVDSSFSSSIHFSSDSLDDNDKSLLSEQEVGKKIKITDNTKGVSDTIAKDVDTNQASSPFLNFPSTSEKDGDKPEEKNENPALFQEDIEIIKPTDSLPIESQDVKADSLPIESQDIKKEAKKWWSFFPINKESSESSKDDEEKDIVKSDVVFKPVNNENETIGQKILDEKTKSKTKEPCIKVDQLRVIYNKGKSNEVRSLDGVDLEIYPEEYIIIYGPSGCGKSTLLYGISGLQAPTYGDVIVYGKNLAQMTKREKVEFHQTKIGMVFQAFYLIETLTVIDNVCLPKVFRGEPLKERREKAMELLRRFGIAEQSDKFPAQLSGGQKQRVSVARALVNNPDILLADEPVGNLDSESAQNVMDIFKEINGIDKKTLILVTHNPDHLIYADRVIYMKDGKKVREEINTDKRPEEAIKKEINLNPEEISSELKLLMRTFKNLSLQQIGVLLIPFKAKQIISHVLSALKEEQISAAENFLKELLFKNINRTEFEQKLDSELVKGGAGWNKLRAESFTNRVQEIIVQAEKLKIVGDAAIIEFTDYLIKLYNLKIDSDTILRFRNFVKLRTENKIDRFGLLQRLDAPRNLGGVGLYKGSAEKAVDEVELIMLLKYSDK